MRSGSCATDPLQTYLKNTGPSLSPFNAWVMLKGLETLELRVRAHAAAAAEMAAFLESHPGVERVLYPGLESHPQHAARAPTDGERRQPCGVPGRRRPGARGSGACLRRC